LQIVTENKFLNDSHAQQSQPAIPPKNTLIWLGITGGLVVATVIIMTILNNANSSRLTSSTEAPPSVGMTGTLSALIEEATQTSTPVPFATSTATLTPIPTPLGGGGKIAFVRNLSETDWEIFEINSDGSGERLMTKGGHTANSPAWSPDGKKLAYASVRDGDNEIYIMNVDGSGQLQLTNNDINYDSNPTWFPDGNRLAFSSKCTFSNYSCIYSMDSNGRNVFQLTQDDKNYEPNTSPDGKTLAYKSLDGLVLLNLQTGEITHLVNGSNVYSPSWSPDGTQIAYISRNSQNGQNSDIFLVKVNDGVVTQITSNDYYVGDPSWSPDGKMLVYYTDQFGSGEICIMKTDGTFVLRLTTNDTLDYQPVWSWVQ
jgi:Tol biopolymer transport system component